jgi:hypothetical protein
MNNENIEQDLFIYDISNTFLDACMFEHFFDRRTKQKFSDMEKHYIKKIFKFKSDLYPKMKKCYIFRNIKQSDIDILFSKLDINIINKKILVPAYGIFVFVTEHNNRHLRYPSWIQYNNRFPSLTPIYDPTIKAVCHSKISKGQDIPII